jgi:hypothetical protein
MISALFDCIVHEKKYAAEGDSRGVFKMHKNMVANCGK